MIKLIGFIPENEIDKFKIDIRKGVRCAQAEINKVIKSSFLEVEKLSSTKRGEGGFGSTGV